MFRALLCPSSRARGYDIDYHIGRFVLGLFMLLVRCGSAGVVSGLQVEVRLFGLLRTQDKGDTFVLNATNCIPLNTLEYRRRI